MYLYVQMMVFVASRIIANGSIVVWKMCVCVWFRNLIGNNDP